MASQLKKLRTITDKITIKGGTLSEDGKSITYINEEKEEQEITLAECLKPFLGGNIDFSISFKSEEELPDEE